MRKLPIIKKFFKKSYEKEWRHRCQLPLKEDLLDSYIEAGCLIPLRRKIKRQFLVSPTNPRSMMFLKSSEAIRQEKARQLQHYYWIVHPFSNARAHWECFMMYIFLISLFTIPLQLCLNKYYSSINNFRFSIDMLCLTDVCINFFTGYYNTQTKQIILDPRKIAIHYVCGFFLIDLISSFPFYIIFGDKSSTEKSSKTFDVDKIAYLKFLRLITCLRYMDRLKDWRGYSSFAIKLVKFILVFVVLLLWMASIFFVYIETLHVIPNKPDEMTLLFFVIYSIFRASYCLFLCGFGEIAGQTTIRGIYLEAIALQCGVIFQLFVFANVIQILSKFNSAGNKYQETIQELEEYVRYKELPEKMHHRLVMYFDYKFQKHFYKEAEILSTISTQLKEEIALHTCRRFIDKVPFFSELPVSLLITIVSCLKSVFYLPNDVIVQAGVEGDAMYFISFGRVAVYTATGSEVCHMSDGGHFGEISLVTDEKRVSTVVAVDPCELLRLSKFDFKKVMEPYPDFMQSVRMLTQDSVQNLRDLIGPEEAAMLEAND